MKALFIVIILLAFAPSSVARAAYVKVSQVEVTQELKDKKLAGKIRSTIAFERTLADVKVTVTVRKNTVIFSGLVNSKKEQAVLLNIVKQTGGSDVAVSLTRLSLKMTKDKA